MTERKPDQRCARNTVDVQFHGLMKRYQTPIYHFLCTMLDDRDMAKDCSQDTFIRAYQHLERGQPVVAAWLYTVARNRAIDELRRRGRQHGRGWEPVDRTTDHLVASMDIEDALSRLSPDDRAILSLVAVDGFSMREIAEMLGIGRSAASMRIARARERLRALLGDGDGSA